MSSPRTKSRGRTVRIASATAGLELAGSSIGIASCIVPLAAIMLALRTALGFSLSCSLGYFAVFKLCSGAAYLERGISAASVGNLRCHFAVYRENKDYKRVSWCCWWGVELSATREQFRYSAPTAKTAPSSDLRHHGLAFTPVALQTTTSALTLLLDTAIKTCPLFSRRTGLPHRRIPQASNLPLVAADRRLKRQHALRNGPELGEVPEELRRRRGGGEENHSPHR